MGVSSGDRQADFRGLGIPHEEEESDLQKLFII